MVIDIRQDTGYAVNKKCRKKEGQDSRHTERKDNGKTCDFMAAEG